MPQGKKSPRKQSLRKLPPEICTQEKLPPGQLPPEKLFYQIFVAFDIIIPLFLLKLLCHKKLLFRCCGGCSLPLSLLGKVFQIYLSVWHIPRLVTHGKTVKIAKSVLCKITARKDINFNKQFRAPTIYHQVLIYHQSITNSE